MIIAVFTCLFWAWKGLRNLILPHGSPNIHYTDSFSQSKTSLQIEEKKKKKQSPQRIYKNKCIFSVKCCYTSSRVEVELSQNLFIFTSNSVNFQRWWARERQNQKEKKRFSFPLILLSSLPLAEKSWVMTVCNYSFHNKTKLYFGTILPVEIVLLSSES